MFFPLQTVSVCHIHMQHTLQELITMYLFLIRAQSRCMLIRTPQAHSLHKVYALYPVSHVYQVLYCFVLVWLSTLFSVYLGSDLCLYYCLHLVRPLPASWPYLCLMFLMPACFVNKLLLHLHLPTAPLLTVYNYLISIILCIKYKYSQIILHHINKIKLLKYLPPLSNTHHHQKLQVTVYSSVLCLFGIKPRCMYCACLYAQWLEVPSYRTSTWRYSDALSSAWTQCICVWHSVFVTVMSSCFCGTLPHFSSDSAECEWIKPNNCAFLHRQHNHWSPVSASTSKQMLSLARLLQGHPIMRGFSIHNCVHDGWVVFQLCSPLAMNMVMIWKRHTIYKKMNEAAIDLDWDIDAGVAWIHHNKLSTPFDCQLWLKKKSYASFL